MRRAILGLVLTAVFGSTAASAETVLGSFDGTVTGFNSGSGVVGLVGWAVADSGVRRVIVQVDGTDIGQALYGFERPIVTDQYPGFPDSDRPAFVYNLNSVPFSNGQHRVSIKVVTYGGSSVVIPGSRFLHFTNNTSILVPFGKIDRPAKGTLLYGTCGNNLPVNELDFPRRYSVIEGWALDLGVEIGDAGMGWVELLVDGSIVADSILGDILFDGVDGYGGRGACTFDASAGGISNCYGLPRQDVERSFPFAFNAPNAGFRFVLDVGLLVDYGGYARGSHVLTIRGGDIAGQLANIAEIPVAFWCKGDLGNEGSFGEIESPRDNHVYGGVQVFRGWALDGEGIRPFGKIAIFIDGEKVGEAQYGVARRLRVEQLYPGYPDTLAPVWRFVFDTRTISDGFHDMQVFVTDTTGAKTLIGENKFWVDNIEGD